MARKLKPSEFDFNQQSKVTVAEKASYPWDVWLDGEIWELTAGEDFQTHPLMMERIIRTRATGRGAKVKMRHVGVNGDPWGKIVLMRTDDQSPAAVKRRERAEKRTAKKTAAPTKAVAKKAPAAKKTMAPSKRPRKLAAVK